MENILNHWLRRIGRAESELAETFRFRNKQPAAVVVDSNYWTFGDLPEEIPADCGTSDLSRDPAAGRGELRVSDRSKESRRRDSALARHGTRDEPDSRGLAVK